MPAPRVHMKEAGVQCVTTSARGVQSNQLNNGIVSAKSNKVDSKESKPKGIVLSAKVPKHKERGVHSLSGRP